MPVCWKVYTEVIFNRDSLHAVMSFDTLRTIAEDEGLTTLKICADFFQGKYHYDKHNWKERLPLKFYLKANNSENCPQILKAELLYHIGAWYYFADRNYPIAFENMLKAHSMVERLGYESFPNAYELLYYLSTAYYKYGEPEKALRYLQLALQQPIATSKRKIDILNTMGLCYRDLGNQDSAVYFFQQGLKVAVATNDRPWTGIISGNLGSVYYKLNKYDEALALLYKDYNTSVNNNEKVSAANAALLIAQIYSNLEKIDSMRIMLEKGRELVYMTNTSDQRIYANLYKTLAAYYKRKGDVAKALLYTDSLIYFKDKISKTNDATVVERARNKIETETHLTNIRLLESEKNKQVLIRNSFIAISFLLAIIGFQTIRKIRLRQKKNLEILELQQRRSTEELLNAKHLLDVYTESIKQKNQLLEQATEEVERLHILQGSDATADKEDIIKRLQETTILTEDDWVAFKKLFTKVHTSFFIQLNEKFPSLTQSEIRFLTLSKLGLSINEKANMLGISPDSVRRTKQRLNKKLGITEQEIFEEIAR